MLVIARGKQQKLERSSKEPETIVQLLIEVVFNNETKGDFYGNYCCYWLLGTECPDSTR